MNLIVICFKLLVGFYYCVYLMLFLYIRIVLNFSEMVNIIFISGRELDVDWSLSVNGIVDYYILYLILDYVY